MGLGSHDGEEDKMREMVNVGLKKGKNYAFYF
jgi:hypothetical protein